MEKIIEGTGLSLHDRRPAVDDLLNPFPVLLRDDGLVSTFHDFPLVTGYHVIRV